MKLQTLHAALSAEREAKQLIIADWNKAEHRARQRQNELEAEIAALRARLKESEGWRSVGDQLNDRLKAEIVALVAAARKEAQP